MLEPNCLKHLQAPIRCLRYQASSCQMPIDKQLYSSCYMPKRQMCAKHTSIRHLQVPIAKEFQINESKIHYSQAPIRCLQLKNTHQRDRLLETYSYIALGTYQVPIDQRCLMSRHLLQAAVLQLLYRQKGSLTNLLVQYDSYIPLECYSLTILLHPDDMLLLAKHGILMSSLSNNIASQLASCIQSLFDA